MPILAKNRRALYEYEILDRLEAGLLLSGAEVKSIRTGHASLAGAYVTFHGEIPYLTNAHIAPYAFAIKNEHYEPTQSRKLLLKKREIAYLRGKLQEKGLTAVPLSLYTKQRYIKLEIGLARGKKLHDKRASVKKREVDREIRRAMST